MFAVTVLQDKQKSGLRVTYSKPVMQNKAHCTHFKQIGTRSCGMPIVSNKEFYF